MDRIVPIINYDVTDISSLSKRDRLTLLSCILNLATDRNSNPDERSVRLIMMGNILGYPMTTHDGVKSFIEACKSFIVGAEEDTVWCACVDQAFDIAIPWYNT